MILAKIENGELITTYADNEDRELINQMVADGFKLYTEESDPIAITTTEFQSLKRCHTEDAYQIRTHCEVIDNDPNKIAAEIARLQAELSASDYRITKAYEYSLIGKPPPYDLVELHSSRQQLRDRINELNIKGENSYTTGN